MHQQQFQHLEITLQVQVNGHKMTATGNEDAWQRTAYIVVTCGPGATGPIKKYFQALTETIDIDTGERDLDVVNLLNLGQIPKHGAVGVCTITFEGYPLYAGTPDQLTDPEGSSDQISPAQGYWDAFANAPHTSATQPQDLDMSVTRTRYRVAILWTNQARLDETAASASDVAPGSITVDSTPFTNDEYNGTMIETILVAGSASTLYYGVTNNTNNKFDLTIDDKPSTDGITDNDSFYVFPTGESALLAASKGLRFVLADCICTSCKTTMTDGIVKQTLVFKGAMFAKDGTTLSKMESSDGTAAMVWLGEYTAGTTRWA